MPGPETVVRVLPDKEASQAKDRYSLEVLQAFAMHFADAPGTPSSVEQTCATAKAIDVAPGSGS